MLQPSHLKLIASNDQLLSFVIDLTSDLNDTTHRRCALNIRRLAASPDPNKSLIGAFAALGFSTARLATHNRTTLPPFEETTDC